MISAAAKRTNRGTTNPCLLEKPLKLLIDADSIVYSCGFAAQRKVHGVVVAEPLANALNNVRMLLGGLQTDLERKLTRAGEKIDDFEVYLTGKNNYREKIATIRQYKGNRDPSHKPVHYDAIREYLVKKWDAKVVHGYEADDAVAMAQHQSEHESTVICSIDKDLKTVPGLNYNFRKKELSIISPLQAKRAFWTQVLQGDATDNIGGCYKVGPKKAAEIIGEIKTVILKDFEEIAYWNCLVAYDESVDKYGPEIYRGLPGQKALLENARLLHMQESPGQLWVPPGASQDWLPGYGPKARSRA